MTATPEIFAFNAEVRAVEEGHHAFVQPGGSCEVKSDSHPDLRYTIRFFGRSSGMIWFTCTCPSGQNRNHLPVPCKHSALVARRLVREKLAVLREGLWWVSEHAASLIPPTNLPEDPFAGVPGPNSQEPRIR